MITALPAVQFSCKRARRIVYMNAKVARCDKRHANRSHRRTLNAITRTFIDDVEVFYDEAFDTPSMSSWDVC